MASITTPTVPSDKPAFGPPLEPGDQLSRSEFERRYDAMHHVKKAELIEGVVYMPSPVRWNRRGAPHSQLLGWLCHYEAYTPGVASAGDGSVRLDNDNEPQPDAILIIRPEYGGQARISDDDYLEGPPELVAEVAASSVSLDLHVKLRVYQQHGIKEYLVWRVLDQAIDWFVLRNGQYDRLAAKPDGYLESETFPGLRLDSAAMVRFETATVLTVLQGGIDSPEHARFVERLCSTSKS